MGQETLPGHFGSHHSGQLFQLARNVLANQTHQQNLDTREERGRQVTAGLDLEMSSFRDETCLDINYYIVFYILTFPLIF